VCTPIFSAILGGCWRISHLFENEGNVVVRSMDSMARIARTRDRAAFMQSNELNIISMCTYFVATSGPPKLTSVLLLLCDAVYKRRRCVLCCLVVMCRWKASLRAQMLDIMRLVEAMTFIHRSKHVVCGWCSPILVNPMPMMMLTQTFCLHIWFSYAKFIWVWYKKAGRVLGSGKLEFQTELDSRWRGCVICGVISPWWRRRWIDFRPLVNRVTAAL